ncbi:MAG: hypothetical protein FJZ90_13510, partial [Chloroflexi bacterium]|nr:hypothetical protein [Chloroflexota bacterium]
MKVDEFEQLVAKARSRPTRPMAGQRHLYVWNGDLAVLNALLSPGGYAHLDLYDVARSLERRPTTSQAARQVLESAIEGWLRRYLGQREPSRVLVVSGCDLLMRYRVPMSLFMRELDESRVVILVAPSYSGPTAPLPREVEFRAHATLDYLRGFVSEQAVIEASRR